MMTNVNLWLKDKWLRFKKWLFIVFGVGVALAGGSQLVGGPADDISKEMIQEKFAVSQLSAKYVSEGASFRQAVKPDWKEKTEVRIGEETSKEFIPAFEFRKWDEVRFKATPKLLNTVLTADKDLVFDAAKMKYKNGAKEEVHFYDLPVSTTSPEGGYEIEWILNVKPKVNKVEFAIETEGLDFLYQPPLDVEMASSTCTATDCDNAHRDENVVGSYAVYASEQKTNYAGKKLYKTGKVGHIFRPKIIDSAGTEVWGELLIKDGILSVTIPQDFLDKAVYPVIVDPTFGYTTQTFSQTNTGSNDWRGSLFTSPADIAGKIITSLTIEVSGDGHENVKGIIVLHSTLAIVANGITPAVDVTEGGYGWTTFTYSTSPSLANSTEYILSGVNETAAFWAYDSGAADQGHAEDDNNYASPTNPSSITHSTRRFSIYATYSLIDQEGFRFRDDDGTETGAAWLANQDTNIERVVDTNTRLRMLLDASGTPPAYSFQLEASTTGFTYYKIENPASSTITELYTPYSSITTNIYSWVAPPGVTDVKIEAWGGGGGGGALTTDTATTSAAGGAGGNFVVDNSVAVTPGTSYTVNVGLGGTGGVASNGGTGGNSWFSTTTLVQAQGGLGGQSYENGYQGGATSTSSSVGDTVYYGGKGGNGGTNVGSGGGGGGAGTTGVGGNGGDGTYNVAGAAGTGTTVGGGNGAVGKNASGAGGTGSTYGGGGSGGYNVGSTTNRNGGAGGVGAIKITYTANKPYLVNSGAATVGANDLAVAYPTGILAGDLLVLVHINKYSSTTPATPSGWTLLGNASSTGGDIASYATADQGDVRGVIYTKIADGTETGTLTVTSTGGRAANARMFLYRRPPGTYWDLLASYGNDSTAGTSWVATSTHELGLAAGDILFIAAGENTNLRTYSAQNASTTGITMGTQYELGDHYVYSNENSNLTISQHDVYSGTASGNTVFSMTSSGSGTNAPEGTTIFLRIRTTNSPIVLAGSSYIPASGTSTTYQLTAPSGKATSDFVTGRLQDDENPADAVTITTDDYTEMEWNFKVISTVAVGTIFDFRVTASGTALSTYTVTPRLTVSSGVAPPAPSGYWIIDVN